MLAFRNASPYGVSDAKFQKPRTRRRSSTGYASSLQHSGMFSWWQRPTQSSDYPGPLNTVRDST
jgi:hypothetical protein